MPKKKEIQLQQTNTRLDTLVYNRAVKGHYNADPDRQDFDRAATRISRAESMGYYAGKFILGYLVGYCIGVILALWVLYHYVFEPFILPIIKVFIEPFK